MKTRLRNNATFVALVFVASRTLPHATSLHLQYAVIPLAMDYGYSNQYSTTSYGAQGGANGGGFLNQGSQDSPAGGRQVSPISHFTRVFLRSHFGKAKYSLKNSYGKDTLRPVTIKQILDAQQPHPDADFKIDGTEVTQV